MSKITVVGNLGRTPELKETGSGLSVCNFRVADNYRRNKDAEEETTWIDVTLFGTLAENFHASAERGMRVIVEGRLTEQKWTGKDGTERTKLVLIADACGVELRFHTAQVRRADSPQPARETRPTDPGRALADEDPF